jgi:hypothetical protein
MDPPKKKPKAGAKMKPGQKQHIRPGVMVNIEREKMWDRYNEGRQSRPYGNTPNVPPHRMPAPNPRTTKKASSKATAKKTTARKVTKKATKKKKK